MAIKDKVEEKEAHIKQLLEKLRYELNTQSIGFKSNQNDWQYLTSLSFTETKLTELLGYFTDTH